MDIKELEKKDADELAKIGDDLGRAGRGLKTAVDAYNAAVGSFERRFLPMGQKLTDLKGTEQSRRTLAAPEPVSVMPRVTGGDVETNEEG